MYWDMWSLDHLPFIGAIREVALVQVGIWDLLRRPELWSYAAIELLIFTLAIALIRDAARKDRADDPAVQESPGYPGSLADATGLFPPRLWFMVLTLLFTFLVELSLSNGVGLDREVYAAADPIDQVPYRYAQDFAITILGVPLWVPVGWTVVIFYLSAITSDLLVSRSNPGLIGQLYAFSLVRALSAALLAVTIDLVLDPIAHEEGWWTWTPRTYGVALFSVPATNFIAWFGIIFSLSLMTRAIRIVVPRARSWRSQPLVVVIELLGLLVALALVTQLIRVAHLLDRGDVPLAPDSAVLLGVLMAVAALALASRYPWSLDTPYQRLVGRSLITLHGLLVLVALSQAFVDYHTLLDRHPELVLWIPGVAVVSTALFLAPYWKSLAAQPPTASSLWSLGRRMVGM